ncbi:MAG: hypothetical protein KatS3mg102_2019 [Planctomycetota bacterium]|nr:MAG: hypothetical protein KatS3mg102_2019 [Planctomycetota bacterium]
MLATQVRQKDSRFYFVAYPAEDLLRRVRFISRFYGDGETIEPSQPPAGDEIAAFIAGIERSDKAFQRRLSRHKVRAIQNFYAEAIEQPPIPATVLLFTPEELVFEPIGTFESVGNLQEPRDPYLIIDGQHRLAALYFYLRQHPEEAKQISVPCVIFDRRTEDFAAEMFVIINSTATRINRSHLVDLYEKVQYVSPDKKVAAKVCELLYNEPDSPLRYKINRLGGRSRQKKWILQAELFHEVHRWVREELKPGAIEQPRSKREVEWVARRRFYEPIRDGLRAAAQAFDRAWDNERYMVTRAVTIKALIRTIAKLAGDDRDPEQRELRWAMLMEPWRNLVPDFRAEGFYERFAAKGQIERVDKIFRRLDAALHRSPAAAG